MPNKMNSQGYTALLDHPNGPAHLGAWCAIVEICSAREPRELRGILPESNGTIGGISRTLGRISRIPPELFEQLLPRLINDPEIAWIEQVGEKSGKSPDASGKSPDVPGTNRREGKGIEGNGTERTFGATAPAESLFSTDLAGPVRSDVPAPTFTDWWKVWWNHTAKAKTQKLWPGKAKEFGAQFLIDAAIADREKWEPTAAWEWRSQMHPTTWLNGKRWEDELPPKGKSSIAFNGKPVTSAADRALQTMLSRVAKGERPA
jgi:hypothetical protein